MEEKGRIVPRENYSSKYHRIGKKEREDPCRLWHITVVGGKIGTFLSFKKEEEKREGTKGSSDIFYSPSPVGIERKRGHIDKYSRKKENLWTVFYLTTTRSKKRGRPNSPQANTISCRFS